MYLVSVIYPASHPLFCCCICFKCLFDYRNWSLLQQSMHKQWELSKCAWQLQMRLCFKIHWRQLWRYVLFTIIHFIYHLFFYYRIKWKRSVGLTAIKITDVFILLQTAEVDYCFDKPCQNNGTCNNLPGNYTCDCTDAFRGSNCEGNYFIFLYPFFVIMILCLLFSFQKDELLLLQSMFEQWNLPK